MKRITTAPPAELPAISRPAARIALCASIGTVLCLAMLHVLSPEFEPAWRMVSEYALGDHWWLLSLMFLLWAAASWAMASAVRREVRTRAGKLGLALLVLSGVGEAMAAFFDVRSNMLHGLAAVIGIPTLPVAAMLISFSLRRQPAWSGTRRAMLWTANLTWVSFLLMNAAMALLFMGLARTEGKMTAEVIAVNGYANRLLVVVYCLWLATAARKALRVQRLAGHGG